jgi:hypothetical protein
MALALILGAVQPDAQESPAKKPAVYATWGGFLEVDKCASAWVIARFVTPKGDPAPVFKFVPQGARITEGIAFDTPDAQTYARTPGRTVVETLIRVHKIEDPALARLARIVRDIELNTWGEKITPEAAGIEAVVNGINKIAKNEQECLDRGFAVFDALYAEFSNRKK